jgi:hypothetical protein
MAVTVHNRHIQTETCVHLGMAITYNRYKFVTVSIPKRLRDGRFRSGLKYPLELLRNLYI